MEDGDEEVLYQTELLQLFSEEDEVYIKSVFGIVVAVVVVVWKKLFYKKYF